MSADDLRLCVLLTQGEEKYMDSYVSLPSVVEHVDRLDVYWRKVTKGKPKGARSLLDENTFHQSFHQAETSCINISYPRIPVIYSAQSIQTVNQTRETNLTRLKALATVAQLE